jgi:nitroimidazol reductase NimA-like FMN-containing flavoprotein (pyridoxamine 5'-phosphate oxidase superfamily)
MPVMTPTERDEFLDRPGILMRIATVSAEGKPLCVPIWYLRDGERILFTPRKMSVWLAHIRHNPSVCLCIDDQGFPYPKVVVEAEASILYDLGRDDEWRHTYRRIACRYVPPDDADAYIQETIDQTRALCAVSLRSEDGAEVRTWRMPVAGESYKGIWADRYYSRDARIRAHEARGTLPKVIASEG